MIRLADAYQQELQREGAATRRLLERVPNDRLAWRPHPKSMTVGRLALHTAEIPGWVNTILANDVFDFGTMEYVPREPESTEEILSTFDQKLAAALAALAEASDEHVRGHWRVQRNGEVMFDLPRFAHFRGFVLSHHIHHRGQLTVYLRLLDVPLPSIYGPSADESMF